MRYLGFVRHACGALALLVALHTPTAAQERTAAPVELAGDQKVWVTASDGIAREGRVVKLSGSAIDIRAQSVITSWQWAEVTKLETPDPLRNGIRNGAIAGVIAGSGLGMMMGYGVPCRSDCAEDSRSAKDIAVGALIGAAVGTGYGIGFGALIDWLVHRRQVVYRSASAGIHGRTGRQ